MQVWTERDGTLYPIGTTTLQIDDRDYVFAPHPQRWLASGAQTNDERVVALPWPVRSIRFLQADGTIAQHFVIVREAGRDPATLPDWEPLPPCEWKIG